MPIATQLDLPLTGFVRQRFLLTILPFSPATFWRRVADGSFPAPVKLSERVTAWEVGAIRRWMAERSAV